jgi:hypothetical protein
VSFSDTGVVTEAPYVGRTGDRVCYHLDCCSYTLSKFKNTGRRKWKTNNYLLEEIMQTFYPQHLLTFHCNKFGHVDVFGYKGEWRC